MTATATARSTQVSVCVAHSTKCGTGVVSGKGTAPAGYQDSRRKCTGLPPLHAECIALRVCVCCVVCCRWHGDNGPRPTDLEGPLNLIQACPKTLQRFVFVTSAGVERQKEFPWAILNTFGGSPSPPPPPHPATTLRLPRVALTAGQAAHYNAGAI